MKVFMNDIAIIFDGGGMAICHRALTNAKYDICYKTALNLQP